MVTVYTRRRPRRAHTSRRSSSLVMGYLSWASDTSLTSPQSSTASSLSSSVTRPTFPRSFVRASSLSRTVSITPLVRWALARFYDAPRHLAPGDRNVIPPLLNDFISLQKDTALVSILGVIEVTRAAQISRRPSSTRAASPSAAIFFLVLTIPMTRFTDRLIARGSRAPFHEYH